MRWPKAEPSGGLMGEGTSPGRGWCLSLIHIFMWYRIWQWKNQLPRVFSAALNSITWVAKMCIRDRFMEMQLRKLPSKFSEVIVLKIWGEQTFQQMAETLEISQNTVASRYRYGIDLLRKALRNKKDQL